ncbi:hypothetical protein QQS21_009483 [Conoideocrella luteorostrata]|uniref:Ankyrin 2,3/unc44 n=1 Tax=Conoideocrella luteorostrata TaxID=1105319 RepID=A0AAJ0FXR4_9HYPO|nr:hypothetical protein QQS21_009483 [Conoideocrella luteorostrata]
MSRPSEPTSLPEGQAPAPPSSQHEASSLSVMSLLSAKSLPLHECQRPTLFPEGQEPAPTVPVRELLSFNEDELVKFVNACRLSRESFDMSRMEDPHVLSRDQRRELAEKLSAAMVKAGPLNANEVSRRLEILADRPVRSPTPLASPVRSPTLTPSPDNSGYEKFCHDELVRQGGRPVMSFERLQHSSKDAQASQGKLEPWLREPESHLRDGDVPPIFSKQLYDWQSFQQKWQWDNRGKYAGEEGFTTYVESDKRMSSYWGDERWVSQPGFEEVMRSIWEEHEPRYLELSGREGFAAYNVAVKSRLASHKFTQSFQLTEDPCHQDSWTTWVEYLGYVYWWLDFSTTKQRAQEPEFQKAWDELWRFRRSLVQAALRPIPSGENVTLSDQLDTAHDQIGKFLASTKSYRELMADIRRFGLRAQWVLEQLPLMDTAPSAEEKATRSSLDANSGKKRKAGRDDDASPHRLSKKKEQEASQSSSALDPGPGTANESDLTVPGKTAATLVTASSNPRRSRRLKNTTTAAAAAARGAPSAQRQPKGALPRRLSKKKEQEASQSSSALDPGPGTANESDLTMPGKTAATLVTASSNHRRSRRLKNTAAAAAAARAAPSSQRQPEGRGVLKTHTKKR